MSEREAWIEVAISALQEFAVRGATSSGILPSQDILSVLAERKIDSLCYLSCAPNHPVQRLYDKAWQAQKAELIEALLRLSQAGASLLTLKSAEILPQYCGDRAISICNDLDFVFAGLPPTAVRSVLFDLGYRHAIVHVDDLSLEDVPLSTVEQAEANDHTLYTFSKLIDIGLDDEEQSAGERAQRAPLWVRDGRAQVLVSLDAHTGLAADVEMGPFFERSVPSAIGLGNTLSPADHLWSTLGRYYYDVAVYGRRALRPLAYLVALLRKADVDWQVVLDETSARELRPAVYYFLRFIDVCVGHQVPSSVFDLLDPRQGNRVRDWGWQLPKLFGLLDPLPGFPIFDVELKTGASAIAPKVTHAV